MVSSCVILYGLFGNSYIVIFVRFRAFYGAVLVGFFWFGSKFWEGFWLKCFFLDVLSCAFCRILCYFCAFSVLFAFRVLSPAFFRFFGKSAVVRIKAQIFRPLSEPVLVGFSNFSCLFLADDGGVGNPRAAPRAGFCREIRFRPIGPLPPNSSPRLSRCGGMEKADF